MTHFTRHRQLVAQNIAQNRNPWFKFLPPILFCQKIFIPNFWRRLKKLLARLCVSTMCFIITAIFMPKFKCCLTKIKYFSALLFISCCDIVYIWYFSRNHTATNIWIWYRFPEACSADAPWISQKKEVWITMIDDGQKLYSICLLTYTNPLLWTFLQNLFSYNKQRKIVGELVQELKSANTAFKSCSKVYFWK